MIKSCQKKLIIIIEINFRCVNLTQIQLVAFANDLFITIVYIQSVRNCELPLTTKRSLLQYIHCKLSFINEAFFITTYSLRVAFSNEEIFLQSDKSKQDCIARKVSSQWQGLFCSRCERRSLEAISNMRSVDCFARKARLQWL